MKSWGEQQSFDASVLSETEYLKAENQRLREHIVVLERRLSVAKQNVRADCSDNDWIIINGISE